MFLAQTLVFHPTTLPSSFSEQPLCTRTECLFRAAMLRFGGRVLHIDVSSKGGSSSNKGESLSDSIRCMECYADVILVRHPGTYL